MASVRCVGGIIHDAAGRLLVIQRGHDPGRGRWSLPGGRVEPDETDAQAVVREMREETGLDVRPGPLAGMVVRGRYEIYDYVCEVRGGRLRAGDDAADARWVDAAAFGTLELTDGLAATLRGWDRLPRC
ncbi:NUDIX domain-containing protein [Amycolatopsis acidiphila]|uniref:NUDIX domain-containing protein n=1 Tax=Amycolatopsis acidiphila TaxID=715473 RepID=A0A558A042_9PSEU|nr:NUDIX domain-containing protein [Amycolatopsis acidiphila]TVT17630.1 NUDIX domain-containing protein [Amycolatopsis acidiphila]UIJ60975.1 NUDIX domain-containing protein [Amycolatopsis acidiphila]GHG88585.1 NUDIX hydrolase [Amycolatopsis acidiphila]